MRVGEGRLMQKAGVVDKQAVLPNHRGCPRLELLVVMLIVGLLAGFVGPKYFSRIGKPEVKVARAQIDALGKALDPYRPDAGHYLSTRQVLAGLVILPPNEARWRALPAKRRAGRPLGQSLRLRRARRVRPAVIWPRQHIQRRAAGGRHTSG